MKAIRIFLLILIVVGIIALFTQKIWVPKLVNKILLSEGVPVVAQTAQTEIKNNANSQTVGIKKVNNQTPGTYNWCIANKGKDVTPNFNAPRKCVFKQTIYEESCISNDKYFVTYKYLNGDVGSDILVKYKTNKGQNFSCNYEVEKNDFEIKNEWAEYTLALENNFLILDSGTGPDPRGLIIYNLDSRKKVYTDEYFEESVIIQNNTINYWSPTNQKATPENCFKFSEYEKNGEGAEGIDSHVVLDLSNLSKKELGEYRCSPRQ